MTKKDRIVALHMAGRSNSQIAAQVGCGEAYVRAALQRHKAKGPRPCDVAWSQTHGYEYDRARYAVRVGRQLTTIRRYRSKRAHANEARA